MTDRITTDPNQCGGAPCVRGMRVRVSDVLDLLDAGQTPDEIVEELPYIELADVEACVQYREGGPLMFDLDEASVRRVVDAARENLRENPLAFTASPKRFRVWDGERMYQPDDNVLRFDLNGWAYGKFHGRKIPFGASSPRVQILQSTGLHDADGVEVFEGDVVEAHPDAWWKWRPLASRECRVVRWLRDGYYWGDQDLGGLLSSGLAYSRVVGNVFENPDLLP